MVQHREILEYFLAPITFDERDVKDVFLYPIVIPIRGRIDSIEQPESAMESQNLSQMKKLQNHVPSNNTVSNDDHTMGKQEIENQKVENQTMENQIAPMQQMVAEHTEETRNTDHTLPQGHEVHSNHSNELDQLNRPASAGTASVTVGANNLGNAANKDYISNTGYTDNLINTGTANRADAAYGLDGENDFDGVNNPNGSILESMDTTSDAMEIDQVTNVQEHPIDVAKHTNHTEDNHTSPQNDSTTENEIETQYQLTNTELTSQPEQFLAAYIKDNNFSPNLYNTLLYSLTQQLKYTRIILHSWFSLLQLLPRSYDKKQILVELSIEVQIEHYIYSDLVCWDLRKYHSEVERVAEEIVRDLELELQWTMMISYAIRRQMINRMQRFIAGGAHQLQNYIDTQESHLFHKVGDEYTITRRAPAIQKYQPQLRQMTINEIRNSKYHSEY